MIRYLTPVDCVCLPELGYTCKKCEAANSPEAIEAELKRQGYGYFLADQDGHDGGEVSAISHKEEEFLTAAAELLDAKKVETK